MRARRGIALVTVLLATALLLAVVAFAVNIGTLQLRRTTEEMWAMQARAGADGGVGWVRALLSQRHGDITATLGDLAAAQSTHTLTLDARTHVDARVAIHLDTPAAANDHLDAALQQNPYVNETPLQVSVTAIVIVNGITVASRSTTAMLRVFQEAAPYSEVVGWMDNAGPAGIDSPGDTAGQAGSATLTELRIHVFQQNGSGEPVPVDAFADQHWSDGNSVPLGPLP
jgi:hypothetical protein